MCYSSLTAMYWSKQPFLDPWFEGGKYVHLDKQQTQSPFSCKLIRLASVTMLHIVMFASLTPQCTRYLGPEIYRWMPPFHKLPSPENESWAWNTLSMPWYKWASSFDTQPSMNARACHRSRPNSELMSQFDKLCWVWNVGIGRKGCCCMFLSSVLWLQLGSFPLARESSVGMR